MVKLMDKTIDNDKKVPDASRTGGPQPKNKLFDKINKITN